MATKTDYYNRIIASLQSDITELKATVSVLQKEIAEMREAMKKASERNSSAKEIPVETNSSALSLKTLPRKEVEILISKMKAVCDEAIKANHENYVEMLPCGMTWPSSGNHLILHFFLSLFSGPTRINRKSTLSPLRKDSVRVSRC